MMSTDLCRPPSPDSPRPSLWTNFRQLEETGMIFLSNRRISCFAVISEQIFDGRVYPRGAYFLSATCHSSPVTIGFKCCVYQTSGWACVACSPPALPFSSPVFFHGQRTFSAEFVALGFCNAGKLVEKSLQWKVAVLDSFCKAPNRNHILNLFPD